MKPAIEAGGESMVLARDSGVFFRATIEINISTLPPAPEPEPVAATPGGGGTAPNAGS
jgi:hypothetical protein